MLRTTAALKLNITSLQKQIGIRSIYYSFLSGMIPFYGTQTAPPSTTIGGAVWVPHPVHKLNCRTETFWCISALNRSKETKLTLMQLADIQI